MSNRFEPNGLGASIFRERYAINHEESWGEACKRVSVAVGMAESNGKIPEITSRFEEELVGGYFMPGGRIWYGAGRPRSSLLNCVSGDTELITRNGLMRAEFAAKVGHVDTLSKDGIFREAQWKCFGKQQLYKIIFENGDEIFATAGHEWITTAKSGGRKRVKTIELKGEFVPLEHQRDFKYDDEQFKVGVRHGLIYGDGSLITNKTRSCLVQFGDSRHLVYDWFDKYSIQYHKRYKDGVAYTGGHPVEWKELPTDWATPSYLRGFIAGVIAADGHVDINGHVMLHSANLKAITQIRRIACSVGIPSTSIKLVRKINPWNGTEAPLYKLSFVKAALYEDKMILKKTHKENMFNSKKPSITRTIKVVEVLETNRFEDVYCCIEPETNTWVTGHGYLTSNCYVCPTGDSRESWGRAISDMIIVAGMGGGIGYNLSPVRGRGYAIRGTGGHSTGSVSLMQMLNKVGDELVAGGGRRLALMLCLAINHPDVLEFLNVKLNLGQLNNANISLIIPTDYDVNDFVEDVKNNKEIQLMFAGRPDQLGRTIKLREVWDTIVHNSWLSGEPGILNAWLANQMNNVYYAHDLVSTNPCGELWLPNYGCCDLGALVLPRFANRGKVDFDKLDESIVSAVRFLDNVLTVNDYPLPEIKSMSESERRIGLGVMGLHSLMMDLGIEYGSSESFAFTEQLFNRIRNTAYHASVDLAIEKGSFPLYNPKFLDGAFIKTLKPSIRRRIKEYGIRNCALLTVAPTGTTSMVQNVTGGIEPLFSPAYIRRRFVKTGNTGEKQIQETLVVSSDYVEHKELAIGAYDIPVRAHLEMQKTCQKFIDNSISKTINLPKNFKESELGDLLLEFLPYIKGTTVYREGSRDNEPLEHVPLKSLDSVIKKWKGEIEYEEPQSSECPSGVCKL